MAKDDLTGNMPMEHLVYFFEDKKILEGFDLDAFRKAYDMAQDVFPH